jgi:hypothetical protein
VFLPAGQRRAKKTRVRVAASVASFEGFGNRGRGSRRVAKNCRRATLRVLRIVSSKAGPRGTMPRSSSEYVAIENSDDRLDHHCVRDTACDVCLIVILVGLIILVQLGKES